MNSSNVAETLERLALQEYSSVEHELSRTSNISATSILIGACQALDYWLLVDNFLEDAKSSLSVPDMSLVSRGWNPLLKLLQGRVGKQTGVPVSSVGSKQFQASTTLLHQLGRSVILKKTAELVRHGNFSAEHSGQEIRVRMLLSTENDLFSDRIDDFKWRDLEQRKKKLEIERKLLTVWQQEDIQEEMSQVVHPFKMPHGTIVGYATTPEIDEHFASLVLPQVSEWQRQSGLFPQARIRGLKGADIASILGLCMSSRLSHSQLVAVGKKKFDEVNYWLANTVWKPKSEIVSSLANFANLDPFIVSTIVDRSTYGVAPNVDLSSDVTPVCPPFIKISKEYLLEPMSFLFSNPLDTFKKLNNDAPTKNSVRIHREAQMAEEIHNLFEGNRYRRLQSRARLKRNGKTITDIDAAVLDVMTGEIGLFQLKWQEFNGANNRQQISRSRNFVDQVDTWSSKVQEWIVLEGTERLLKSLQFPVVNTTPNNVYLFAIGQQAARFSSFGFPQRNSNTAPATMNQFVRLRLEMGHVQNTVAELFKRIRSETRSSPILTPIPYNMTSGEYSIHFEDMWNSFE
ncbi:hypothetical protein [Ruegeria atlantica]|uniref:hypothetical protein n=1 Tax=Ruegeria atlantica TaxID=81569 RepID=UPI00147A2A55|nr:hypothetical protein [Ruegeria atlantica]